MAVALGINFFVADFLGFEHIAHAIERINLLSENVIVKDFIYYFLVLGLLSHYLFAN
jgi:hypothetical protein